MFGNKETYEIRKRLSTSGNEMMKKIETKERIMSIGGNGFRV
jgi:hypothetical protein